MILKGIHFISKCTNYVVGAFFKVKKRKGDANINISNLYNQTCKKNLDVVIRQE